MYVCFDFAEVHDLDLRFLAIEEAQTRPCRRERVGGSCEEERNEEVKASRDRVRDFIASAVSPLWTAEACV